MNSTWSIPPSSTEFSLILNNQSVNHTLLPTLSEDHSDFPLYIKLWVTIASGIIFIVGVGGNTLVPILVWKNKQMRHSTNIFLLNLAVADCLILLICLPTALVELHTAPNTWILGAFLCRLVPFIEITVTRASIFTLTVISVERYIAICKPLRANSVCTRPRAFAVCLCIWPMSFLAAGPVIVATEYREPNPLSGIPNPACVTSLHNSWTSGYYLGSAFAFFLCPLFFLSGIYFFIAKKLLSHRARSNKKLDNAHWNARKQVAGMLGAVVIIFFVCLLPFQILIVWVIQAPMEDIKSLGPHIYFNILFASRVLVYINAAANPIIYNAMSAKFRKALVRLFAKEPKNKILRRHSTLTTMFSSSSNASSRSNSFRRIANFALKRSFSDASIRRQSGEPRLSSPSVLSSSTPSSPKGGIPLTIKTKDDKALEKWYLKKGTSGSYFSGGDSVSSFSTLADDSHPSPSSRRARFINGTKYNSLLWDLQNGCWNRSLPEIYPPSPGSVKRVSFKDNILQKERPRVISPLTFNFQAEVKHYSEDDPQKSENSSALKSSSKFSKTFFPNKKSKKIKNRKLKDSYKINEKEAQKLNGRQSNSMKNNKQNRDNIGEEDESENDEEVEREDIREETAKKR